VTPLFDAQWFGKLAMHTVAGFEKQIPAVCYRGQQLHSPFPLGSLGTGYLELRGDGKLGLTSIANSFVPQQVASGTLLTFTDSTGKETPLDAEHAEIVILAHFPVINIRYGVAGKFIWLRAFVPMIPGDSKSSNTPGILFAITADEGLSGKIRINTNLSGKVAPTMEKGPLPKELAGANLRFIKGKDFRGDITLAWIDGSSGTAKADSPDQMNLSIEATNQSGETKYATLAWFFPWFIDAGGEPHMNRYASHFKSSVEVAQLLAKDHESLLKRIIAWQNSIYQSGQPDWICNALVQSLYSYAKNSMWVDEHRTDRWYEPDGFFTHSESNRGCPITETMVCRAHGHLPTLFLWPELERSTLAGFAHFQLRNGEICFSFGMPYGLRDPRFHCQHPLTSSQFIQQVHRYFLRTGDEAFVKRIWQNVVDAMKFGESLDYDDDGLINEHAHALPGDLWPANQFYDQWPWYGTSAYVAGTWLGTLRAIADLADRMHDRETHDHAMKLLEKAGDSYRKKLWNGSYFRLWSDPEKGNNETCLANQLMGQWCCRIANLEPVYTKDECASVAKSIEKYNAAPTQYGLINGGNFQGELNAPLEIDHGHMIFVGENLCASMTGMYEGHAPSTEWAKKLVWTIHEHQGMPFDQFCMIRRDNGAPAWGNDYYSNLVVWALPMANSKIGIKEFAPTIDAMIKAAEA
jgi:uncharacterized protein (DUF608 family)